MEKENIIKQILSTNAKIEHSLHGGMMNESYLVKDTNKKYVLYMPTKQANEMVDRSLEAYNHSLVYPLGITSKNIYFNVDEGIKINEFIKGNSLNHENVYDVTKIADLLKTLHTKAPLTYKEYNPFERLANFEKERQLTNIELDIHYNGLRDIVFNNIDFLKEDKLCLSHNDFQKSNIIKTKQDNYFVIDFEFMMNNYESYDIACFANDNLIDGINLLKAYKKDEIKPSDFKRFYIWRIFVSLQWYNVALIKHYRGEGKKHNINFLLVASHFINIALEAKSNLN